MQDYPLVSIITINYKQAEVTNQLLQSLAQSNWPNIEVVVVDNNSGQEQLDDLIADLPWVTLVASPKNLGFAGGNNLGLTYAKGDFILFLNNDTEVHPNFIEPLVELLSSRPSIGAVSPLIKYHGKGDLVQYAGFSRMNPFTLRMKAIGHKHAENKNDHERETPFAHGCALMFRRSLLQDVGTMASEYFLYYEEHDWSTRIRKAGYQIYFQPRSVVYHKESVSVKRNSPLKTYFLNRNRILYLRRNFGAWQRVLPFIYLVLVSAPKNTLSYLLRGKLQHLKAYVDALIWNITNKTKKEWSL